MFNYFFTELPFPITDELLRLPGYKPKIHSTCRELEPSPPLLPPKQRQRRHSDTVTSLTDSSFLIMNQNENQNEIQRNHVRSLHRKHSLTHDTNDR